MSHRTLMGYNAAAALFDFVCASYTLFLTYGDKIPYFEKN